MTALTIINPLEIAKGGVIKAVPIPSAFDSQLLTPHIYSAELEFVKPVLCADLYANMISIKNTLDSSYTQSGSIITTLVPKYPSNAVYETLWKQLLYSLCAWSVYHKALPFISMQAGSNGLYLNNSEWSQNAGVKGLQLMLDSTLDTIKTIQAEIKQYLCDNRSDFPLFPASEKCPCSAGCGCGECNGVTTFKGNDFGLIF